MVPPGKGNVKDPVGVIESAYSRQGDSEAQWLARVASEVRANLTGPSEPMLAWTYYVKPDGRVELGSVAEDPVGLAGRFLSIESSDELQAVLSRVHLTAGLEHRTY